LARIADQLIKHRKGCTTPKSHSFKGSARPEVTQPGNTGIVFKSSKVVAK
jgi:hypothetical protein